MKKYLRLVLIVLFLLQQFIFCRAEKIQEIQKLPPSYSYPFVWLIKIYQLIISPQIKAGCKFHPSCSNYALQSVKEFGFLGIVKASERLQRCHSCGNFYYPIRYGRYYDPVKK